MKRTVLPSGDVVIRVGSYEATISYENPYQKERGKLEVQEAGIRNCGGGGSIYNVCAAELINKSLAAPKSYQEFIRAIEKELSRNDKKEGEQCSAKKGMGQPK